MTNSGFIGVPFLTGVDTYVGHNPQIICSRAELQVWTVYIRHTYGSAGVQLITIRERSEEEERAKLSIPCLVDKTGMLMAESHCGVLDEIVKYFRQRGFGLSER